MLELEKVENLLAHIIGDVGSCYSLGALVKSDIIKLGMNQRIEAHEHTLRKIAELWPETLRTIEVKFQEAHKS